jgi:hypothetical protein
MRPRRRVNVGLAPFKSGYGCSLVSSTSSWTFFLSLGSFSDLQQTTYFPEKVSGTEQGRGIRPKSQNGLMSLGG